MIGKSHVQTAQKYFANFVMFVNTYLQGHANIYS